MHCLNYTCKQYSTVNAILKKCRQGVNRYTLINLDAMINGGNQFSCEHQHILNSVY